MSFSNYAGMLTELAQLKFSDFKTNTYIQTLSGDNFFRGLREEERHEIVRLFNIHCIPKKFENIMDYQAATAKPKRRKK